MCHSPPLSPVGSLEIPSYYVQIPTSNESSDTSPPSSLDSQSPTKSPLHSSTTTTTFDSSDLYQSSITFGRIRRRSDTDWTEEYSMIEEDRGRNNSSDHYLIPVFGFIFIFSIFCFILWGVSRPIKTQILVKDFTLHKLNMGIGSDHTGVPTTLLTLNTSLKVSIYNPATFFGVHVSAHPLLLYSGIPIATTRLRFYQPRQSRNLICIKIDGGRVPLYGAAGSFVRAANSGRIPLRLEIHIQALGKVFGPLVKTQQRWNISCPLSVGSSKSHKKFEQNSCEYN